jgi:hypothetical protein
MGHHLLVFIQLAPQIKSGFYALFSQKFLGCKGPYKTLALPPGFTADLVHCIGNFPAKTVFLRSGFIGGFFPLYSPLFIKLFGVRI